MTIRKLICNEEFDVNCNYEIYDCRNGKNWHEANIWWSTLRNGFETPPKEVLDAKVGYITINYPHASFVIEAK